MASRLTSRKLWVTLIHAAVVALNEILGLGLDAESILSLTAGAVAYVASQGFVDTMEKKHEGDTE